jgi:phosphotriesterase-related protein
MSQMSDHQDDAAPARDLSHGAPLEAIRGRSVLANGLIARTVLGDIPSSSLGTTLCHEHLISSVVCYWQPHHDPDLAVEQVTLEHLHAVRKQPHASRDNLILDDIANSIREVDRFRAAGGSTIVEVSSLGLGRDVRALQLIASRSGVAVIAGSGYYVRQSHPTSLDSHTLSSIADELISEITVGVDGTQIRAGVIGELGVGSYPMHPIERRVLRAAVLAQRETGAGMIVHPASGIESAFEIVRLLQRAGARMDKVCISHLDERFRGNVRLFRRLSASACLIGFDTFGRELYYPSRQAQHPSDTQRIEWLRQLIEMGLGDRIVLAQDIVQRMELTAFGGRGYAHILESIVPRLLAAGVPDGAIVRMLVDVPRTFLEMKP